MTGVARVGAALGVAVGPVAGWAQAWSGAGDGRWYIWVLASLVGALVGALGLPVFFADDESAERDLVPWFGAAFLFTIGILAGAAVAFPMGAVMGSLCGLLGGAAGVFWWRVAGRRPSMGSALRLGGTALAATTIAFFSAWWWTA